MPKSYTMKIEPYQNKYLPHVLGVLSPPNEGRQE